jgi:hypothetical protein
LTQVKKRGKEGDRGTRTDYGTIGKLASNVATFAYDYDDNKNKTKETISGVMADYGFNSTTPAGYDAEDRLIDWARDDGNMTQAWHDETRSLSAAGDWRVFIQNATTQSRTHNAVHELTDVDQTSLAYDARGNLTTNANGQVYTWDFDNRMTSADTSVSDPTFKYDALGRRVSKTVGATTTVYAYDGQQVVAEYTNDAAPASPARQFVYAEYIDEPVVMVVGATKYYYHQNNLYSVAALTDSDGDVVERYAYTAYGAPTCHRNLKNGG